MERLGGLAAASAGLSCDADTAARYGDLKATLRANGTPIPENDFWIAALAMQHDLTLASRDEHFDLVPAARTFGPFGRNVLPRL